MALGHRRGGGGSPCAHAAGGVGGDPEPLHTRDAACKGVGVADSPQHVPPARARGPRSELQPLALGLASLGSVVATAVTARFGLAGTLTAAALTPVLITLVKELGRRPAETILSAAPPVRRVGPGGEVRTIHRARPAPREDGLGARLRRVRWGLVTGISAVALALTIGLFTVPDLIAGRSVVSGRDNTFFAAGDSERSRAPGGDGDGAPATTPTTPTAPPGTTESTRTAPQTAPPPEEPVPTAPAPAPPLTIPQEPVPTPVPSVPPAPAPAPPPGTTPAPEAPPAQAP